MTTDKNPSDFPGAFFNALAGAMTATTGSPWLIAAVPDAELLSDGSAPVWIKLVLDGSLRGEALLEFRRGEAAMLASKLLGKPEGKFGTEQSIALMKVIKAGADEFCSAHRETYGAFTIKVSSAPEGPSSCPNGVQVTAADNDENRVSILMCPNPALTEALRPHSQPAGRAAEAAAAIKEAAAKMKPDPINLNLVMDVELNVTLRFGRRQLTLREVMELTSGSVVELDRQVEEPVELLLDGIVIARGEAVVIDGNYGLRVTEVSQAVSPLTLH